MDRRSVIVQQTLKGSAFLRELRKIMGEAAGGRSSGSMRRAANA
jgi:DNA-binding MarR family transcriptional regulator